MSFGSDSDLKCTVLHIKWKVNIATQGTLLFEKQSSTFKFLDKTWHLLIQYYSGSCNLFLLSDEKVVVTGFGKTSITLAQESVVTVHVESPAAQILPALTSTTRLNDLEPPIPIWKRSTEEIMRASPEVMTNFQLGFIIVFEATGNKTRSTSVQTILHSGEISSLEKLSEDLGQLMVEGSDHDVEFRCAGQSTGAHRSIVCRRSQVIASMLAADMVEGRTGVVKIPDIESDVFTHFLRYMYSGQLPELTVELAASLYECGDRYAVMGLVKACSHYLMEHLTTDDACRVLALADAHGDGDFKESVIVYLLDKEIPLSGGDGWRDLCDGHPKLANEVLGRFCFKISRRSRY